MLEIIIILAIAFVVIPLIDLVLKERLLYAAKLVVYGAAFLWLLYTLFFLHRM
jgi:hypothetical protein